MRDPHVAGSYGFCPFLAVTGLPCAGCGGLRAIHDLAVGDPAAALASNAAAVVLVVLVAVAWVVWTMRRLAGHDVAAVDLRSRTVLVGTAAFVLFGVLRWTPWGAALGP